jgi:predicted membrane chloride channel (bestrophin family)
MPLTKMDMEEMMERLLAIVDTYQERIEEERKAWLELVDTKIKAIQAETKVILAETKDMRDKRM